MISPRWAGLLFGLIGTVGMAVMASTESFWIAVLGGALVAGGALNLVLSVWRVAQANRRNSEQRLRSLTATLNEVNRSTRATNTSINAVAERLNRVAAGLNGVAARLKDISVSLGDTGAQVRNIDASTKELRELNARTSDRVDAFTQAILEEIIQLQLDASEHDATVQFLGAELKRGQSRAIKDRDRVVGQVHGIVALYSIFRPSRPFPDFGSWAISADLGRRYVARILRDRPRVVFEVGSGLSTVLCARALELIGDDGHVFALEHESHWSEVTEANLSEHGLAHRATVIRAPLADVKLDAEVWKWYDLEHVELPEGISILLVDGPPQSTGPLARYPALPILLDRLTDDAVIFLDDGIRADEAAVLDRWLNEIPGLTVIRHKDKKETFEIHRVSR